MSWRVVRPVNSTIPSRMSSVSNTIWKGQLAKIQIPNKDEAFLRERMLTMYANPVRNYLKATAHV